MMFAVFVIDRARAIRHVILFVDEISKSLKTKLFPFMVTRRGPFKPVVLVILWRPVHSCSQPAIVPFTVGLLYFSDFNIKKFIHAKLNMWRYCDVMQFAVYAVKTVFVASAFYIEINVKNEYFESRIILMELNGKALQCQTSTTSINILEYEFLNIQ